MKCCTLQVNALLVVRPGDRLTAEEGLRHPWLQGPQFHLKRPATRKESPVLDTAKMRSWLARRRWLKGGQCALYPIIIIIRWLKAATVLRALQRLARFAAANTDKKETQQREAGNYSRLQEILDNLDKM